MGDNLFQIIFSAIKSRLVGFVAILRQWTSWNFISAKIVTGLRTFFFKLLDVKPKNKDDYYTVFGWMVSKRLAYAAIIIIGALSLWYVLSTLKVFERFGQDGGMRTYNYDSVLLRLASKRVRIRAAKGYIAYEGDVDKGAAEGNGVLYTPEGQVRYDGQFAKSRYEGAGKLNYDNGVLCYQGDFHNNLYEGSGVLYREDGTKEYEGSFSQGLKNGDGKLYDGGGNGIYTGSFAADHIVYSDLLDKAPEDIKVMYTGPTTLYQDGSGTGETVVYLKDIGVMYLGVGDSGALDDTIKSKAVYVLSDTYYAGTRQIKSISDLQSEFGNEVYEGNSVATLPEAIAINKTNERWRTANGRVDMQTSNIYTDDISVDSYDTDYSIYIHSYKKGDLVYSFVGGEGKQTFDFYYIMDSGDSEAA